MLTTPRRSLRIEKLHSTPKNDNRATDDKENNVNNNKSYSPSTSNNTEEVDSLSTRSNGSSDDKQAFNGVDVSTQTLIPKQNVMIKQEDQGEDCSDGTDASTQTSTKTITKEEEENADDDQSTGGFRTDDDFSTRSNGNDTVDSVDGEQAPNVTTVSTQTPIRIHPVMIKQEDPAEDDDDGDDDEEQASYGFDVFTQTSTRIQANPSIKLEENTSRVEEDIGGYDDKSLCLSSSTAHSHLHEEKEDDSCESEDTFIQAMSKKHDDKTHDAGKERDNNEDNWTSDNEATHPGDIRCLPSPVQSDSVYAASSRLVDTVSDSSLHDVNSYVDDVVQVADDEVIKHEHEKEDNSSDAGNYDQVSGDEIYEEEEEEDDEISEDYQLLPSHPDSLGNADGEVRSEERDNDGVEDASDGSHSSQSPVQSYTEKSVEESVVPESNTVTTSDDLPPNAVDLPSITQPVEGGSEQSADDGEAPSSLADTLGTYDLFGTPLSCDNGNSPSIDWSTRSVESSSSSDIFDVVDKDALIAELQLENKLLQDEKEEALFFKDTYRRQADRSNKLLINEEEESKRMKLELAQCETSKEILQAEVEGLQAMLSDENTRCQLLLDISNRGLAAKDAKIRKLQHQSNALNVENATLNEVVKSLKRDVKDLTSSTTRLEKELSRAQDENCCLKNDKAELEGQVDVLEEENSAVEKQLTTAKHEIASLKDSNGKLKDEKSVVEKEFTSVRNNLIYRLAKCQGQVGNLTAQVDAYQDDIWRLENENEALNCLVMVQASNTVELGYRYETNELMLLEEGKLRNSLAANNRDYEQVTELSCQKKDLKSKLHDAKLRIKELKNEIAQKDIDSDRTSIKLKQVKEALSEEVMEKQKLKEEMVDLQQREQSLLQGFKRSQRG